MENISEYATPLTLIGITIVGAVISFIQWHANVNADRKTFKEFMNEIKNDIKTILLRLPPSATSQNSPIRLTELGDKIVQDVKPEAWISMYADQLLPQTEDKTLYQIQQLAFEFAEKEIYENAKGTIRMDIENCAFRHGISVQEVLKALGVVLRDKIFQAKGLSVEDI